jgi:hypothetical protein
LTQISFLFRAQSERLNLRTSAKSAAKELFAAPASDASREPRIHHQEKMAAIPTSTAPTMMPTAIDRAKAVAINRVISSFSVCPSMWFVCCTVRASRVPLFHSSAILEKTTPARRKRSAAAQLKPRPARRPALASVVAARETYRDSPTVSLTAAASLTLVTTRERVQTAPA